MNSILEIYNKNEDDHVSYLREGYVQLPLVFAIFAVTYFVFFVYWTYICIFYNMIIRKIHILMAALILVRFFDLFCLATNKHIIDVRGISSNIWKSSWYIFHAAYTIIFPTTFFLLFSGWSIFKHTIWRVERHFLFAIVSIEAIGFIPSFIFFDETGRFSKGEFGIMFNAIHDVWPWLVMGFTPIIDTMILLEMRILMQEGVARRNFQRFQRLIFLFLAMLLYLAFNIIAMLFARYNSYLSGNINWVVQIALWEQSMTLLFHGFAFHLFQPNNEEQFMRPRILLHPEEVIPNAIDEQAARNEFENFNLWQIMDFGRYIALGLRNMIYMVRGRR